MKSPILIGALAALVTGVVITAQAALLARSGGALGATRTGLFTYLLGGVIGGAILVVIYLRPDRPATPTPAQFWALAAAGAMGVTILTGIAFAGVRIGVGAAMGAMLLGQMVTSVVVDALGWTGELIPITPGRLLGLAALGLGAWLLLPKE